MTVDEIVQRVIGELGICKRELLDECFRLHNPSLVVDQRLLRCLDATGSAILLIAHGPSLDCVDYRAPVLPPIAAAGAKCGLGFHS
jgi:hypothetical protein